MAWKSASRMGRRQRQAPLQQSDAPKEVSQTETTEVISRLVAEQVAQQLPQLVQEEMAKQLQGLVQEEMARQLPRLLQAVRLDTSNSCQGR